MIDCTKDRENPKLCKGVYSIPYSCRKLYMREIGRSIHVRLKEHCADMRNDRAKRPTLVEHAHNTRHHICIEKANILAKEGNHIKRKMRETLEIELHPNNINMEDGEKLGEVWNPLAYKLQTQRNENVR